MLEVPTQIKKFRLKEKNPFITCNKIQGRNSEAFGKETVIVTSIENIKRIHSATNSVILLYLFFSFYVTALYALDLRCLALC